MPYERIFLHIATLFFFGGFALAFWSLRRGVYKPSWWNLVLMAGGFICQSGYLFLRGQASGRCPVTNTFELLIFVSWAMVLLYFLVGSAYRWSLVGMFTAPLVFAFHLLALIMKDPGPDPAKSAFWNELHKSLSLLSFGAFALACVAGVMFLVQDRQLKQHHLRSFLFHLPPIHNLTKAIRRLILLGVILLTVGIASAYRMDRSGAGGHSLLPVWMVWGVYASILIYEVTRGMSAKKAAAAAVGGFLVPMFTLWLLAHH